MKVNTESQVHYISPVTKQELTKPCMWWLNGTPYILGCVALKGLSELALKYPADLVIQTAVKSSPYLTSLCVLVGAFKFWKGLEAENNYLEAKKVEYVRIPKNEFDNLQSEMIRLRQQIESKD